MAPTFTPERLTLARQLRGYTKTRLAEQADISASAISQYENGQIEPKENTLRKLAVSLGVPTDFFRATTEKPISLDDCHFRSLRSTTKRRRRALLARGRLAELFANFLADEVHFPEEQVTGVREAVTDLKDIEKIAKTVRKTWGLGLGPIPNVVKLLESKGILVIPVEDEFEDVDAFSFWHSGPPCIMLILAKGSSSRSRFDAAHELGHLVMHIDANPGSRKLENEANQFASAFLLPRETFGRECPRRLDWQKFLELKVRWRVSLAAMVRRVYDLGYISKSSYHRAFRQLSKRGWRTDEPNEPPYEAPVLLRNALDAVASDYSLHDIASCLSLNVADLRQFLPENNTLPQHRRELIPGIRDQKHPDLTEFS